MEERAKSWIGLDTFGTVSETVDWGNGPGIYFLHSNCKLKLRNARASAQAKKRIEKKDQEEDCEYLHGTLLDRHTISIDDSELKTRLQTPITGCTNPFAAEIRYHPVCWRKYISNAKDEV